MVIHLVMCVTFCRFLENWELVGDLLSHLNWLIANVQHGDANIALANYRRFKNNVSEQVNSNPVSTFLLSLSVTYVVGNFCEVEIFAIERQVAKILPAKISSSKHFYLTS